MKTLWMEVADLIQPAGQGFTIRGDEVLHRCLVCNAEFPQTDEGRQALKDHGFNVHEFIQHYDWMELHGQKVTIYVVQRQDESRWEGSIHKVQTELIARTKDGTVYFLPFSYYDAGDKGGFKWKPRESSLQRLMPGEVASPSNG